MMHKYFSQQSNSHSYKQFNQFDLYVASRDMPESNLQVAISILPVLLYSIVAELAFNLHKLNVT